MAPVGRSSRRRQRARERAHPKVRERTRGAGNARIGRPPAPDDRWPATRAWITRTTTPSSVSRGPRPRLTSRRRFASSPASITPTPSRGHGRRTQVQGGQRGQRGPRRSGQAQAIRRARRQLGGDRAGPGRPAASGAGRSVRAVSVAGGNVRYEFRTSSGETGDFSDFFRVFFGEDAAGGLAGHPAVAARARPAAWGSTTSWPGWASTPAAGPAAAARTRRHRRPRSTRRPPRSRWTRPTTARPAGSRWTASGSRSRSRPAPTPARGSS